MEERVWRKGNERCERSYRQSSPTEKKALSGEIDVHNNMHVPMQVPMQVSAPVVVPCPPLNRREEASAKMNERYLIGQATQNPFMTNSNYANDLEVQLNFLTPRKSSI
jgi:hypothetical protein